MLWRNDKSVIIGKNQNALQEVDFDFVKEHNIKVVRRLTGGGAVFHDLGNVNFTFILKGDEKFADYSFFTRPIIELLGSFGINATLSGRNDMLIDGKKFSGNAQCAYRGRVLHHGTIMLGADLSYMSGALNVNPLKVQSKGIKSVKSRVTNINEHLKEPVSATDFIEKLAKNVLSQTGESSFYELTKRQTEKIKQLCDKKYSTWEWNFGFRRDYTLKSQKRFDGGIVEAQIKLKDDKIFDIKFFGDFFSKKDIADVENLLKGTDFVPKKITDTLNTINIDDYFSNITTHELLSVIF